MNDQIKIRFSFGLLAIFAVHALIEATTLMTLHPRSPESDQTLSLPQLTYERDYDSPPVAVYPLQQPAHVNLEAQGEIKQGITCIGFGRHMQFRSHRVTTSRPVVVSQPVYRVGPCPPVDRAIPIVTAKPAPLPVAVASPVAPTSSIATAPPKPTVAPKVAATATVKPSDNDEIPKPELIAASAEQPIEAPPCLPCQRPTVLLPTGIPAIAAPQPQQPTRAYQVALFVGSDAVSQQLLGWFNTDPTLQKLKSQVDFQVFTTSNVLYKSRYAAIIPPDQFPAIVVQDSTGGHVHAAGKTTIPNTAEKLISDISLGFQLHEQVMQSAQKTGAIKSRGYSWDSQILPSMQLGIQDLGFEQCPGGECPSVDTSVNGVVDLFKNVSQAKDVFAFLNNPETATTGLLAIAVGLVVYMLKKRGLNSP